MGQSCAHARIEWGNPVPTPGLTAGRVSGEKTLRQRYCEDSIADGPSALARQWGFRDETQIRKRCAPHRIASGGFFGQNRKLQRSRKTDLGVERSRFSDLGRFSLFEKLLKSLTTKEFELKDNTLQFKFPGAGSGWRLLCRTHVGLMWDSCRTHVGLMWDSCRTHVGLM